MITVYCCGLERTVQIPKGQTLLASLLAQGVPLASSCDGQGVCGRCVLKVLSGAEQLVPALPLELEVRTLAKLDLDPSHRLACCVVSDGALRVWAPYWGSCPTLLNSVKES